MSTGRYRQDVEAIKWTGANLSEIQDLVGVMANMDGDVSTVRFLDSKARNDEGERIWNNPAAHLWSEASHRWLPVPVGHWVIKGSSGYLSTASSFVFEHDYTGVER